MDDANARTVLTWGKILPSSIEEAEDGATFASLLDVLDLNSALAPSRPRSNPLLAREFRLV